MKQILLLSLFALTFVACEVNTPPADADPDAGDNTGTTTQIRFMNGSVQDFDSLEVIFGTEETFDALSQGLVTEYRDFEGAYHYGYLKVMVGNDEYIQQPIDFVGETLLEVGKYTYTITLGDFGEASGSIVEDD